MIVAGDRTHNGLLPNSVRLGRVRGVPIGLHFSWFIIAALITVSLGARFQSIHGDWGPLVTWAVAAVTALLFFAALLAHELAHAVVAMARGLRVRSITLFALGGVASIERDANTAKTEFLVAVVGPAVSLIIGIVCLSAARALGWTFDGQTAGIAASVLGWLGSINVVLALFNLIPGYPLDGGRILRAVLWSIYKQADRASRNAARVGQVVALIFMGWGGMQFLTGSGIAGLWLALIGWFLFGSAQAAYTDATLGDTLRDVRVGDIMRGDCVTVDGQTTVQDLVDKVLLRTGQRCVMVLADGEVQGLVTPEDVSRVERARWSGLTVRDVMRPIAALETVEPATPAAEALKSMIREGVTMIPVIRNGHLEGIVSRGHILQLIQSRGEFSRAS